MKTWQKLAITAGIILVAMTVFLFVNGQATNMLQTIVDWVFTQVFNFKKAPELFVP